jgi:uncharacterized coiled-coil DUF342 family protein
MAGDEHPGGERQAELSAAYAERTKQLHDARGALAEAVAALTAELEEHRSETAALRDERDRVVAIGQAQHEELTQLRARVQSLDKALEETYRTLAEFREMKVVRWSEPVRRFVYRLRKPGR